ncbi:MAG: SMC family ATPase [Chloroflexi bacterium]|nr:SMC family ATPase [Chloroflexota bacterium]
MLPTRLELRNFLAYRNPDPIIFDGIHLACLTGPNGAGKTSLLDAITWALWGKARVRSDDDLIHQGQLEMLVQLDFLQGATLYRVVRKRQKGKTARTGRSALDLFVWDEGADRFQPISAPSIRETGNRISDLLRLDYETFIHSAFLQQGHADAFTVKTPAQRKEILAEILGLEQWGAYETHAKNTLRQIDHDLGVIAARVEDIERQEAEEPALRRDLEIAEVALEDAAALREEAEIRYKEVAGAEEQMIAAQSRLAQAEHRIKQRQADLDEIVSEVQRHEAQKARLEDTIQQQDSIQEGYAQLQAAREVDQELGQKLQEMTAIKDRLADVNTRIQDARAELEAQVVLHRDRMVQAERASGELDVLQSSLSEVQAEVGRLEAEERHRDELRDAIHALNEESAELRTLNRTLYDEMQALRARIDDVQAAEAVCPTCGQPLDEVQKEALLDDLQTEGTDRGDTYRANQARLAEIEETIAAYQDEIAAIEVELRKLQALRDRATALTVNLDTAQEASRTLQSEGAEVAVLETMLESGDYAQELQAQRDSVQAEIDTLGYDSDAHSAARATLSEYHDYERRQHDLETALAQLPEIEETIATAAARRARWIEALAKEEREAEAARLEIDGLTELVAEARRRDEEVRRRRTEEKRAQESVIRAQQALTALENARQRKADLEARRVDLSERKSIFEDLRDAFGKNGIPAMIIEAAIPELEESANQLLSRMTDGRMHVRLDTQREKRTGGVAETLDILISDELGTRSYESYSGGEAFRVNFAIRVALSQMLARRAGAQLRTLFIDEGFGTQDEAGRQRLVEAITAVQDHFDLLLVITHIAELRDVFPVQIAVDKTPDGSRVSLR